MLRRSIECIHKLHNNLNKLLIVAATLMVSGCGLHVDKVPELTPSAVTLVTSSKQQFSITQLAGGTTWSINGTTGGNANVGTITPSGLYTPPIIAPSVPVTVTASSVAAPGLSTSATVQLLNPEPKIDEFAPAIFVAGDSSMAVNVRGSGFIPISSVAVNGIKVPTTYVSATELQFSMPSSISIEPAVSVSVSTPGPGGGEAPARTLPILSPGSAVVYVSTTAQFRVADLPGGTVWMVNGIVGGSAEFGYISATGVYSAPPIPPTSNITITAQSSFLTSVKANAVVAVHNPAPILTGVDQSTALVPPNGITLGISGHDFTAQSQVVAGSSPVTTGYVSESELKAQIAADKVRDNPTLQLSVQTPGPGGGVSSSIPVTLIPTGTIQATAHPLVAEYSMALPAQSSMTVEFGIDDHYGRNTWTRPAPDGGGTVAMLVAGMRSATTYHLRAYVDLSSGVRIYDSDHVFTTGPLPQVKFPRTDVSPSDTPLSGRGVDLISSVNSAIGAVVTDPDGAVVWYNDAPLVMPIRQLSNGNFLITAGNDVREVDLAGTIVRQITADDLNAALNAAGFSLQVVQSAYEPPFHHDAIRLDNGHWILLVSDDKTFDDLPGYPGTTTVAGDALIDLDENNHPVWVWRAFDHLDVNRHPIWFPDWTHSNAVVYTPDGNLLVSMRHQSWVIKIDYANGTGSGAVLWRLGPDGDFTLASGDPQQWFYTQHFPVLLDSAGSFFHLAIFDNGDARPDATGQPCIFTGGCYTRAIILSADESARTADISWQYSPGWFASWGGSVGVLPNGNVEFDSSTVDGAPARIIEVTPGSMPQVVWQMDTSSAFYRAYRIPSLYPGVQW